MPVGAPSVTFALYRSTDGGNTYTHFTTTGSNPYTDSPSTLSEVYYYIEAVYAGSHSTQNSVASNIASTQALNVPQAAPAGLSAAYGRGQIVIAASTVSSATGYNLYRGFASGTETLYQAGLPTPSYTDTVNVEAAVSVFYRMSAVNACGEGSLSSEVSVSPQSPGGSGGLPPPTSWT
jgi:hypothetical protein